VHLPGRPAGIAGEAPKLVSPSSEGLLSERRPVEGEAPFAERSLGADHHRVTFPPGLVETFHVQLVDAVVADHPQVPAGGLDPDYPWVTLPIDLGRRVAV
jgi:hypothetical protein